MNGDGVGQVLKWSLLQQRQGRPLLRELHMKRIFAGIVLALLLTGAAAAGPLRDGAIAYQSGDYATALRHWRPPVSYTHLTLPTILLV